MTSIRRLSQADLPEYTALLRSGLAAHPDCFRIGPGDTQDPPQVGGTEEHFTLGAFSDGGGLVGIVSFARETQTKMRHKGLLFRMHVTAEASGQGVGRKLIRDCVGLVRALPGLEAITLTVVASNAGARHLYASEGFVPFAREPNALKMGDTYYDEEQMRLDLRDV